MTTLLQIKNFILKNIFRLKRGKLDISKYELVFEDDFKTYNEDKWMRKMYFGEIHPDVPQCYSAEEAVEFTENGLLLNQYFNNRTVEYWDGKTYNTILDTAYLTSKDGYGYGLYEWEVKMANGQNLWNALWLTGFNSWPPEIDVVEYRTDLNRKYNNKVNTDMHYGVVGVNKENIKGRKSLYFKESELLNDLINFKLIFEENLVKIYVNDFLVRKITDKKIMKWFNDQKFYVVMNTHMYDIEKVDRDEKTSFNVKFFKYYKK